MKLSSSICFDFKAKRVKMFISTKSENGKKKTKKKKYTKKNMQKKKARYTATKVACGWTGAKFEVTRPFKQEQ